MRTSNQVLTLAAAAAALLFGSSAQAAVLSGAITADNAYDAYISTSDSTLGTLVASGDTWQTAQTFTTDLTAGQTYYLHVVANNLGGPGDMAGGNPDALLGSFSLSGSGFTFANGTQTLTTDTTDWRASPNDVEQDLGGTPAWTAPTGTPISFGVNGGSNIWGNALGGPVSGVSTSAQWIWSASDPSGEAFFSTTLTSAGGVPEPAAWALLIVGFGLTGATLRRRRALTPARVSI